MGDGLRRALSMRFHHHRAFFLSLVLAFSLASIPAVATLRDRDTPRDPDWPRVIDVVKRAIKRLLPPKLVTTFDDTASVPKP
jgi:hypothetical protein